MSAFDEIRGLVDNIETAFNLLSKEKDPNQTDEQYDEDTMTAVYEAYGGCLELQGNLKSVCATLRKSYKLKDAEVKAWLKSSEEDNSASLQDGHDVPNVPNPLTIVAENKVEDSEPKKAKSGAKRGRKPKAAVSESKSE